MTGRPNRRRTTAMATSAMQRKRRASGLKPSVSATQKAAIQTRPSWSDRSVPSAVKSPSAKGYVPVKSGAAETTAKQSDGQNASRPHSSRSTAAKSAAEATIPATVSGRFPKSAAGK